MLMIVVMCFALCACGNSSKSPDSGKEEKAGSSSEDKRDDDSGNSDSNGYEGNNGDFGSGDDHSGDNVQDDYYGPNFVGGYEVAVYRAGDDTILAELISDSIYNNDDSYYFLEFTDGNDEVLGAVSLNSHYSSVSRTVIEHDGDHRTVTFTDIENLGGNEGTDAVFGDHRMLITMSKPGAWDEIPDFTGCSYELRRDSDVLARGKAADIMKNISPDELSSMMRDLQMSRVGQNPVQADWTGKYISGYNSPAAYLEVEVSKTDIISFHLVTKDAEYDWFAEESYFDKSEYDGTHYISASCYVTDRYGSSIANMSFNSHDGSYGDATIDMSCNFGEEYVRLYFSKFNGLWHTQPADFEDKDTMGLMSDSVFDADCFKPATDDYMLQVTGGTIMSGLYAGSSEYECENIYVLYSYDSNGNAVQYVDKYVLSSEDKAQEAYHKITDGVDFSYATVSYVQSGRNVYKVHDVSNDYYITKQERFSSEYGDSLYLNCHYIYPKKYDDISVYYRYMYLSKPFTEAEYSMSLRQMLYWKAMDWNLPCIDDPDYSLRAEVNELRTEFSVDHDDYTDEEPYMKGFQDGYLRFHGGTAEGISVSYYEYENRGTVLVHEYTFGAEEITVTEYQYSFTDPKTQDITLDNYKTKTADAVITHTFRVVEKETF